MRLIKYIIALVVYFVLVSTATAWTFHGDEQRTGNFTAVKGSDLIWMLNLTTNYIECSPVAKDDYIYVMTVPSMGGKGELGLYKIYARNGTVAGSLTGKFYGRTTPTIYDNLIFVHAVNSSNTSQSWLYCIYANNLTIKWARLVNSHVDGWWHVDSEPLVYNGKVYVLSYYDGVLYAFDLNGNKRVVWNNSTFNPPCTVSPYTSPSAYNGLIFFAGYENGQHKLVCIYENNWSVKWKYNVSGAIVSGIAINYGYAYFTTTNSTTGKCKLYAVNITDPFNLSWSVTLPATKNGGVWRITPAVGRGYVIVGTRGDRGWKLDANDSVLCYNAFGNDHKPVWVFNKSKGLNGDVGGSPIIAGDYVFFTTNTDHGTLYALYLNNGSLAWSYDLQQWCLSTPFVWNGKIFVGADNGNLYCFGKLTMIWNGRVTIVPANITIKLEDGSYKEINGTTALASLVKASMLGDFDVKIQNSSGKLIVTSINRFENDQLRWNCSVNGILISDPANYTLNDGDVVVWTYDERSSNKTLVDRTVNYTVKVGPAGITNLKVSNANRGGNCTAYVNVTALTNDWYVVVVSGLNNNGDYIAGISTFYLNTNQNLSVPVLIHIPQRNTAGTYKLYAGIYRLSDYPNNLIDLFGAVNCEVSS